jgi:hypothetical protein
MPVSPTYPGVYIEEVPSGVRTITGVATSITAFIGRTLRGPVDEAITINNYGDFERIFGGLWKESKLGYAVRDFYLNGGSQAIIVRLFKEDGADDAPPMKTPISVAGLSLEAAYPGSWGQNLRATVNVNVSEAVAKRMNLDKKDLFNLTIRDTGPGGQVEQYLNLTVVEGQTRRINDVLEAESQLVRYRGNAPSQTPQAITDAHASGDPEAKTLEDPVTVAEKALAKKKLEDPTADVTAEEGKVKTEKEKLETSDGVRLDKAAFIGTGKEGAKKGLYALEDADLFNLLCIPPYDAVGDVDAALTSAAAAYCEKRRAMLLVDPPSAWTNKEKAKAGIEAGVGTTSKNAALFFPRLKQPDPLHDDQMDAFVPCGAAAGVFARTDTQRGVWKAPAGLEATLNGVPALSVTLTDAENGELNPLGINCLRAKPPAGRVIWGSRTLQGDDRLASEWKYIPVRRLALYIEESLYRGTQWVVFEPNDEPLWAQIRLNVGAFMHNLFRQGAFQGTTPKEAYFVKCDSETTTQNDINLGIVNIVVGFAPLKPAEFVIIKLQQMAGQIEV